MLFLSVVPGALGYLACRRACDSDDPHAAESARSEEHTSELQSQSNLVCRLLLEKKKKNQWTKASAHAGQEQNRILISILNGPLNPLAANVGIWTRMIKRSGIDCARQRSRDYCLI